MAITQIKDSKYTYNLSDDLSSVKKGDSIWRTDEEDFFQAGSTITNYHIECPNYMGAEGVMKSVCKKLVSTNNPAFVDYYNPNNNG